MYDAEVAYTDAQVARLFNGLRQIGRLDDALVVFTSDHGENLGERGTYYEHGATSHDANLRVPLIISGPQVTSEVVDHELFRMEDLMPTLLELLEVPPANRPTVDGVEMAWRVLGEGRPEGFEYPTAKVESGSVLRVDMYDFVRSGRAKGAHCINDATYSLCWDRPGAKPGLFDHQADPDRTNDLSKKHFDRKHALLTASMNWPPESARERAVRTRRFKLVDRPLLKGGYERSLYDLESDPDESRDVADLHPRVMRRLERELDEWASTLPSFQAPLRDEEDVARLRALGYVQ